MNAEPCFLFNYYDNYPYHSEILKTLQKMPCLHYAITLALKCMKKLNRC